MIIKELFEGPVGDYCIARITIKCLFNINKLFEMCPKTFIIAKDLLLRNINFL